MIEIAWDTTDPDYVIISVDVEGRWEPIMRILYVNLEQAVEDLRRSRDQRAPLEVL